MNSVLNTLWEYTYFYLSKNIHTQFFLFLKLLKAFSVFLNQNCIYRSTTIFTILLKKLFKSSASSNQLWHVHHFQLLKDAISLFLPLNNFLAWLNSVSKYSLRKSIEVDFNRMKIYCNFTMHMTWICEEKKFGKSMAYSFRANIFIEFSSFYK